MSNKNLEVLRKLSRNTFYGMFSPGEQIVLLLRVGSQMNSTLGPVAFMRKGKESRAELWGTVPVGRHHASDSLACQQKHLLSPHVFCKEMLLVKQGPGRSNALT